MAYGTLMEGIDLEMGLTAWQSDVRDKSKNRQLWNNEATANAEASTDKEGTEFAGKEKMN